MTELLEVIQRPFSEVSAVVARGTGTFDARVDGSWTIGGRPNGGYLLAMLGQAAATVTDHADVIAASAHYVRSPEPGAVVIATNVLRKGRSASQVRAEMAQDGQTCVEALLTLSALDHTAEPYWDRGLPPRVETPYEECVPLTPRLPSGTHVAIMEQIEVRLEPAVRGFTSGQPSGTGELRGWLSLPKGEDFGPASLLFAVDAYPPATFEIEFAGWVPTLNITAFVRALPAPGPVRVLQRAHLIDGQRVDESCFIWDSAGRLVAQGTQLAGIRLG
jgi:Thioesterase-like superfamily